MFGAAAVSRLSRFSSAVLAGRISRLQTSDNAITRGLCTSVLRWKDLTVTYEVGSQTYTVKCKEGENLLDVAINNDLDIDGFGACEGTLACSTCHLIFKPEDFSKIEDVATDEELDMLDLAFGLTDTSRLGCQVCMTAALDGVVVKVPEGVNDQR